MAITLTCPNCRQQSSVGEEFAGKNSVCPFCNASLVVPRVSGQAAYGQPAARPKSTSGWVIAVIVLAVSACVLLVCGGVLLALLLPAVNAAREAARRTVREQREADCSGGPQLRSDTQQPISAGCEGPPESGELAVELLPFMEQNALYQQYDKAKAWDDPANQAVLNTMPREFKCPSDTSDLPNETSYFMLTGPGTVGGVPGSGGVSLFQIVNGLSRHDSHRRSARIARPLDQAERHHGGRIDHAAGTPRSDRACGRVQCRLL